jgi:phosphonate degradation associated HDIG domain protein
MKLSVSDIAGLFENRGAASYGSEAVSQLEHALQCAMLAEDAGATPELVAACLLHDLGHLVAQKPHAVGSKTDDLHQYIAMPFLRGAFTEAVLEPIRLHVDAKRYLCAVSETYRDSLSPASKHSLELQGGVFSEIEAQGFIAREYASDAALLRRWDDQAKTPGKPTPPLAHYTAILESCAL